MPRIIEIVEHDKRLNLEYGSLCVRNFNGVLLEKIDLDEIIGVTCYPHGSTVSAALLAELANRSIPFTVSSKKYEPIGVLLPVVGNFEQSARIASQINMSAPMKKQIWASVVRHKIKMQLMALQAVGVSSNRILFLLGQVKSGDSTNCEAQVAKIYWRKFLGDSFRRDREQPGANAFLNYGYAVLRSSVARSIASAGLNPSIGIFHRHNLNGMRLVDDLMEPFRPMVDLRVHALVREGHIQVTPIVKRALVDVLMTDVPHARGFTPVSVATQYVATSYVQTLRKLTTGIDYPVCGHSEDYFDFNQLADWAKL